mgnify:FL=1
MKLKINYSKSVKELIKAGNYSYTNSDITSDSFPSKEKGTVNLEAILFKPRAYSSFEGILKGLEAKGLRAGTLKELLEFGIEYPKGQSKYPIVAVGSVWRDPDDRRSVPCLWSGVSERGLDLRWFADGWRRYYRFLAFRKSGNEVNQGTTVTHEHYFKLVCSCGETKIL